jgi:hypothetical protein
MHMVVNSTCTKEWLAAPTVKLASFDSDTYVAQVFHCGGSSCRVVWCLWSVQAHDSAVTPMQPHTSPTPMLCRYSIVEGRHALWSGVSEPYKHMIRAFLVHFQGQILSQVSLEFNFKNGSIGGWVFGGGGGGVTGVWRARDEEPLSLVANVQEGGRGT